MKIQIFGAPRSGTTCLYEAFRDNINYAVGIFEPLTPSWNYNLQSQTKITNHLKILNKCNLNVIEKNILWNYSIPESGIYEDFDISLVSQDVNFNKILDFYISYFKNFDKLIFLYRKNIDENAKSLAISISTDNYHQPYKDINIDYTSLLPLIKLRNKMVENLSNYFNIPVVYYENLYSNNIQYINSFLDYFDIEITNLDQFYSKLNTKNRLRQLK